MGKYLIAGSPGSGKTSVIRELERRGFSAYDTDSHPGASRLQDKQGNFVSFPDGHIDWDIYEWNWQKDIIEQLLSSDSTVFLGGITTNGKEMYALFDKIFVLTLDDTTLKDRILSRTDKDCGKHPDQLKGEIEYRPILQAELLEEPQAVAVNAMQPINKVVDEILEAIT